MRRGRSRWAAESPPVLAGSQTPWEEGWGGGVPSRTAQVLSFLHNFWIFSATMMGFSLRIFSAASAL